MIKNLSVSQTKGLEKLGQCMLPGDGEYPGFASIKCVELCDRIFDYMGEADLKDLKMLLGIFCWLPSFFISFFVAVLDWGSAWQNSIGNEIRIIRLGIRGLIMTLYYSHPLIQEKMGYKVDVYTKDLY